MSKGFLPEGEKLHQMQSQRPGAFIAITESGRVFEVVAMMEQFEVMSREWGNVEWDNERVEAENLRVQTELHRIQSMQGHGGGMPAQKAPSGIIKPGQIARPGTI